MGTMFSHTIHHTATGLSQIGKTMNRLFCYSTGTKQFLYTNGFAEMCTIDSQLDIVELYRRICLSETVYTCPGQMIHDIIFTSGYQTL